MSSHDQRLTEAYAAFNARDIDGALRFMHQGVEWANGMEGGFVKGHRAVRDYWTRQWETIDPHVEPLSFETDPDGNVVVGVHQLIRDRDGNKLSEQMVLHIYKFEGGLVRSMKIKSL